MSFCRREIKNFFTGQSVDDFAQAAGEFLVELNRIHPSAKGTDAPNAHSCPRWH